jgi:hypothetical protein
MMQVDHRFEENLTPERIDAIVDQLRKDPAAHPGPATKKAPAVAPVKGEKVRSGAEGARARGKRSQA